VLFGLSVKTIKLTAGLLLKAFGVTNCFVTYILLQQEMSNWKQNL